MAEGHVSIPPTVYIVIGAAVVLMSLVVGLNSTGIEKMSIFVLVGAVFIVVGFLKFLSGEERRSKAIYSTQHAAARAHPAHHAVHPSQHPAHHAQHQQHPHAQHPVPHAGGVHPAVAASAHQQNVFMKCPGCGIRVHPSFKYCQNCGHMLRR